MTEPAENLNNVVLGLHRNSLEGKVIYACPHCGGPGAYSGHISIANGWIGCYDRDRAGQPVGDICPNCNKARLPDLDKGELKASIPLWLWNLINSLKRFYVRTLNIKWRITS